jgi:DNA-binding transcriptional ArsR family regulator
MNEFENNCKIDLDELNSLRDEFSSSYDDEELNHTAEIIKAIADPKRLQILYLLKFRDLYVCELEEVLDRPQSTISHHLNILKNIGLVKSSKEGIWKRYELKNPEILVLVDNLCETVPKKELRR